MKRASRKHGVLSVAIYGFCGLLAGGEVQGVGFQNASSWATFDPGDHGVENDPDGYNGGVGDGRFICFVPHERSSGKHGEVLRFDTAPLPRRRHP